MFILSQSSMTVKDLLVIKIFCAKILKSVLGKDFSGLLRCVHCRVGRMFLSITPSDSLAHPLHTGTGLVPQLVLGIGEGGHGLLSLVRRDLVPLLQPGGMVPMLGFSQVFCVYYLKLRELV